MQVNVRVPKILPVISTATWEQRIEKIIQLTVLIGSKQQIIAHGEVDVCPGSPEWGKAARAGSTSRYPWGQEVTCEHAIVDDGITMGSVPNEPDGCGEDRTWPRASRAANVLGLYDMHGNAGEWTGNWYASKAIIEHYAKGNLTGPSTGKQRVVRGGSWDENRKNLRSSFRNVKPPVSGRSIYGSIGFRCTYDTPE